MSDLPKILIIDDTLPDRVLYRKFLGEINYSFDELESGEGVIDKLKENPPDLILLDWHMPKISGLETLKMLKRNLMFKEIPVIIITGSQDEKVLAEAFDYGGIDFLNKPVSSVELKARVFNIVKLHESSKLLIQQKKELEELNNIINVQKENLKESLELKSELARIKEDEFEKEIEGSKRKIMKLEVTSSKSVNHLNTIKKTVTEVYKLVQESSNNNDVLKKIKNIERSIAELTADPDINDERNNLYDYIDPSFVKKLIQVNPRLTPLDIKHCSFIKMNLDNYEVSQILSVEMKSLQMTRYRLKKKLKLGADDSLQEFIHSV